MLRVGVRNILYNTTLNIKSTKRITEVAFADGLLLIIRGEYVREDENFANIELTNMNAWSKKEQDSLERSNIQNHDNFKEEK